MPHIVGHVDNLNGQLAHYNMLALIRQFAIDTGWEVLRYDTSIDNRELILKGTGMSGTEEIFIGFHCYQNADADYYNLAVAGFTGYLANNTFMTQPGVMRSGIPAHNQRIDYWLTGNAQRIVLAMKVGTPVYESGYVGKILPYGRPEQYPYPLMVAGMLNGVPATRFSDLSHSMPYKGNRTNFRLRTNDEWRQPYGYPWGNNDLTGTSSNIRDTGGVYPLLPIEVHDNSANLWGTLDGVFYISGFDNVVENTMVVDGHTYVVIQDVHRTGHTDYYAMRLDN